MGIIKKAKKKIKEMEEKLQPKMQEETEVIETSESKKGTEAAQEQEEPKEQPITFGAEAAQTYNLQMQQTALLEGILAALNKLIEEVKKE